MANTFLPWFPLATREDTKHFLREHFLDLYKPIGWHYAICLRNDDIPIGYIHVNGGESHDLGYGLRRDHWGQGLATEAGLALIKQAESAGLPYLTATHDVHNPASGAVMRKLGMTYQYSYIEQWQPKNIPVIFRMYQINLDGQNERIYRAYWRLYPDHFVEESL